MMRYEESGDFTTTLHRRLLYILNENLPGSTWYCIAMKMLQYYGDLDMISIEEMASLCAVSKSTISKFIRVLGYEDYRTFQKQAAINFNRKQRENYFVTDVMRYIDEHSTDAYVDAVKEAANVWAVPVIDLNSICGLYPNADSHARYFHDARSDRLHPNAEGHYRMAKALAYQLSSYPANFE